MLVLSNLQSGTKVVKNQSGKIPKSLKSQELQKITELAELQFLSVKRVLTLVTPCTVIYLAVLIETLLYCIFLYVCQLCTNRAFGRV